jgi:hypothetical protein
MANVSTVPAPIGYGELRRWLPEVDDRARALGVSHTLIRACDSGRDIRRGALPQRRVSRLLEALRALEATAAEPAEAGALLLRRGPTGQTPAEQLRRGGQDPGDELRGLLAA